MHLSLHVARSKEKPITSISFYQIFSENNIFELSELILLKFIPTTEAD